MCGSIFDTQLCVDLISVKSSVYTVLIFSIRNCKTVVVVCSDHIVVDRLCVRRRLGVLVCSLWQELVQKHICVLGPFLPSFRYINCIAYC